MSTKDQERKALEQIRKIVAGLGENSYIATAFDGCFEIAEQNIENDFACSMKQRVEAAEDRAYKCHEGFINATHKMKEIEAERESAKREIEKLNAHINFKSERIDELNNDIKEAADKVTEYMKQSSELENKLAEKENEIIKLKAKLYDLITKE